MGHVRNIDEIKVQVRNMAGKSKIFRRAKTQDVESVLGSLTSKIRSFGPHSGRALRSPMKRPELYMKTRAGLRKPAPPVCKLTYTTRPADIRCLIAPAKWNVFGKALSSTRRSAATLSRRLRGSKFPMETRPSRLMSGSPGRALNTRS